MGLMLPVEDSILLVHTSADLINVATIWVLSRISTPQDDASKLWPNLNLSSSTALPFAGRRCRAISIWQDCNSHMALQPRSLRQWPGGPCPSSFGSDATTGEATAPCHPVGRSLQVLTAARSHRDTHGRVLPSAITEALDETLETSRSDKTS